MEGIWRSVLNVRFTELGLFGRITELNVFPPRVKRQTREANHSPPLMPRLGIRGAVTLHTSSWHGA